MSTITPVENKTDFIYPDKKHVHQIDHSVKSTANIISGPKHFDHAINDDSHIHIDDDNFPHINKTPEQKTEPATKIAPIPTETQKKKKKRSPPSRTPADIQAAMKQHAQSTNDALTPAGLTDGDTPALQNIKDAINQIEKKVDDENISNWEALARVAQACSSN